MASFFSDLFGFPETDYATTKAKLQGILHAEDLPADDIRGEKKTYKFVVGGKEIGIGTFSTPSVAEMRENALKAMSALPTKGDDVPLIQLGNDVGEAGANHVNPSFMGGVFQAASQFNCLEMPSPNVTPEEGIANYVYDRTQGPACAIACAAGTAFRNYLCAMPDGSVGQTRANQLNTMSDVEAYLKEHMGDLPWEVCNGYIEGRSAEKLTELNTFLGSNPEHARKMESLLRIGVHYGVQVTQGPDPKNFCCQTYNSACSVGYSRLPPGLWEPIARLVLRASYEATLFSGVVYNAHRVSQGLAIRPVVLTKVGAGVFANEDAWVIDAVAHAKESVERVLKGFGNRLGAPIPVLVVHFGHVDQAYQRLESRM